MSESPKKPLPFSSELPQTEPVTAWPPEVQKALFELLAFTLNERAEVLDFNVPDVTVAGVDHGSWKITVARVS